MRDSFRSLARRPGLALVALVLVGPCIGATISLFSVVDAMVFRPLPYEQSDRLVQIQTVDRNSGEAAMTISDLEFEAVATMHGVHAATAFWAVGDLLPAELGGRGLELNAAKVDHRYFEVMQVPLAMGRSFTEDEVATQAPVAMVSAKLWRQYFGTSKLTGDAVAFRSTSGPVTVIGVFGDHLIPSFVGPQPDVLIPNRVARPALGRGRHMVIARVDPGVAFDRVQAQLNGSVLITGSGGAEPLLRVAPLDVALFERHRPILWLLIGATLTVLLAASVNLGILLLDVNEERRVEHAVKLALGATPTMLIRLAVGEATILVAGIAAVATVASSLSHHWLLVALPSDVYRTMSHSVDSRSIASAVVLVVGITTTAVTGVARSLAQLNADASLFRRALSAPSSHQRFAPFMALQIAFGVAISIVALTVNSAVGAQTAEKLGYVTGDAVSIDVRAPRVYYPTLADRMKLYEELLESARKAPGVIAAGGSNALPLTGGSPERRMAGGSTLPGSLVWRATPGYFAASGIRIEGREFNKSDQESDLTAIVTEKFAADAWPGQSAVGRQVVLAAGQPSREVVAVVGDVRPTFERAGTPAVYLPFRSGVVPIRLVVRTDGRSSSVEVLAERLRQEHGQADIEVVPLESQIDRHLSYPRFQLAVFSFLAGLALVLAGAGVYVVSRRYVTTRQKEIGLQLALGASRRRLQVALIKRQLGPVAVGIVSGALGAWAVRRFVVTFAMEIGPTPVPAIVVASLSFAALAVLTTWLVSRRMASNNPLNLLRSI